jgi:outer membrane protein OmpA-like peptidoglycan-associated protein
MNYIKKLAMGLSLAALFAGSMMSGISSAQTIPGYAMDNGTKSVVRNSYDECWQTSSWNESLTIAECGGVDVDMDGVMDDIDICIPTPEYARGMVNEQGAADEDEDGVYECRDRCRHTPKGAPVDEFGCQIDHVIVINNVNFAFDKANLDSRARAILDNALPQLANNPKLIGIEVGGHTDSIGAASYNQGLSERRAQSVANYLAGHGVDVGKMSVVGYGETQPVASNATREGRSENRRVELKVDVMETVQVTEVEVTEVEVVETR